MDCNNENKDKSTPREMSNDNVQKEKRLIDKYTSHIVWVTIIFVFVLFILPVLFSLLGAMWPKTFSGAAALQELKNNLNSAVGLVSLILGIFSIFYAFVSNKALDKQKSQQDEFLKGVNESIGKLQKSIENLERDSHSMYDMVRDMHGKDLQSADKAKEK